MNGERSKTFEATGFDKTEPIQIILNQYKLNYHRKTMTGWKQ